MVQRALIILLENSIVSVSNSLADPRCNLFLAPFLRALQAPDLLLSCLPVSPDVLFFTRDTPSVYTSTKCALKKEEEEE